MRRPFAQVNVFSAQAFGGNPLAVVLDGQELTDEQMAAFSVWTNLSETTFILPPTDPGADYRVRIFALERELPFAGHPTLGTCHAWLSAHPERAGASEFVQQCGAGLVRLRRVDGRLAFAAPPLTRYGPIDDALRDHLASMLRIDRNDIVDAHWVVNGPEWVAVLLANADAVLGLQPGPVHHDIGVVGPYPPGSPCRFEVRAFFPKDGGTAEDPVTGSLNASLARWLLDGGLADGAYVASQGTKLQRQGRIFLTPEPDGTIWVGGDTLTCIDGHVEL